MAPPCLFPDIRDAEYCSVVLQIPLDKTEDQVERELLEKASSLGIRTTLPSIESEYRRNASVALSDSVDSVSQGHVASSASEGTSSTYLTPHSSIFGPPSPRTADSIGIHFAVYEKYLAEHHVPSESGASNASYKSRKSSRSSAVGDGSNQSVLSVSTTRRGLSGFTSRMLRKKPTRSFEPILCCQSCRRDLTKPALIHNLSCGHAHCTDCLRLKIHQACHDESLMPPRCCSPLQASTIQALLEPAGQETFVKAVMEYSTPWELRIFCPNASCRHFIPHRQPLDPKAPFSATCRKCHTRVCVICRNAAHAIGKDCPADAQVEASPKTSGGHPSCKRCYRCRSLVKRRQESTRLECACLAQFCALCGGLWDSTIGCPNICISDDETAKRRDSNSNDETGGPKRQDRAHDPAVQDLLQCQEQEMVRFCTFMAETRASLQARYSEQRLALGQKHREQEDRLKEEHTRTACQLEDGQIQEEMELRANLEQSERSIRVRIKHMEAYCEGLSHPNPQGSHMPPRVVTEQNLRDLGSQYNMRDSMQRRHEAKINMMRDRQSKRMSELLEKHEDELEKLAHGQQADRDELETAHVRQSQHLSSTIEARKARLTARWHMETEVLCRELEDRDGVKYALLPVPTWSDDQGEEAACAQSPAL
ncbi:hypothetical protein CDD82_974 [Ophiocordyceps australis]|uniref:RBR-type E3 ubiquitin transferase n=1 Tax=Ophiocordyceps australis TaxID=1399860 RepID=A0A2C5XPW8_9HYPO|nr:hypothetical protein CDD82_974 [Ophiocordyceps australis]